MILVAVGAGRTVLETIDLTLLFELLFLLANICMLSVCGLTFESFLCRIVSSKNKRAGRFIIVKHYLCKLDAKLCFSRFWQIVT